MFFACSNYPQNIDPSKYNADPVEVTNHGKTRIYLILDIDDRAVAYSPFLKTLVSTTNNVERFVMGEDKVYIIPDEIEFLKFHNYMLFISGNPFTLTEEDAEVFDYMGHHNDMQYPLDYYKEKLRNTWIKDNFFTFKLNELDETFGLKLLDEYLHIVHFDTIKKYNGLHIGGQYAVTGNSDDVMDLYVTDVNSVGQFLSDNIGSFRNILVNPNHMSFAYTIKSSDAFASRSEVTVYCRLVLKLFTCVSEIAHSADIDCCGVVCTLLDDGEFHRLVTEMAEYAINHNVNWFDPMKFSESYAYELAFYNTKGYKIILPFEDRLNIDVNAYCDEITTIVMTMGRNELRTLNLHISDERLLGRDGTDSPNMNTIMEVIDKYNLPKERLRDIILARNKLVSLLSFSSVAVNELIKQNMIDVGTDPMSIIVLAKTLRILPGKWIPDEHYRVTQENEHLSFNNTDQTKSLSINNLEPIDNLDEFYLSSPYISFKQ